MKREDERLESRLDKAEEAMLSRRGFLKGAAVAGIGIGSGGLLAACGSGGGGGGGGAASGGSKEVIYSSWGGSWADNITKAWFQPFTKATGIKVTVTGPPDYGKIQAMVTANNTEWDIAEVGPDFQFIGAKKGVLTPINWNVVHKAQYMTGNPLLHTNDSVPQSLWSAAITWRTDKFKEGPKTWADVWDTEKFPGKRTFDASTVSDGSMEAALLADGVSPSQLYPLDIDRALKKFDEIKSDIIWFKTGAQMVHFYQTGQAVIGLGWDGRVAVLHQQAGTPVAFTYDNSLTQWADMIVPKGAPHSDAAMKLLEFAGEPKQQAKMSELSWYGPVNPAAFKYIPKSMRSKLSGSQQALAAGTPINWKWWAENYDAVNAKFTGWLSS